MSVRRRIVITGANGQLGRLLLPALSGTYDLAAIVRSAGALARLAKRVGPEIAAAVHCCDPWNADSLRSAVGRCDAIVHLVGTIRETSRNRFRHAHEAAAEAVSRLAGDTGCRHLIYISILGADHPGDLEILQRRLAVEQYLRDAIECVTTIRVPMVLGAGDRASRALARSASRRVSVLFGGDSLEQPIYAQDLIAAITNAIERGAGEHGTFNLAGPTVLTRRELVQRVASVLNTSPILLSAPFAPALAFARFGERFKNPAPLQSEMLRLLDHDDNIDPMPAAGALGIELTSLDDFLPRCIRQ
ncbi:MAG: SDR family oxidoreductase [Gammaproteobacteria bacterium]